MKLAEVRKDENVLPTLVRHIETTTPAQCDVTSSHLFDHCGCGDWLPRKPPSWETCLAPPGGSLAVLRLPSCANAAYGDWVGLH